MVSICLTVLAQVVDEQTKVFMGESIVLKPSKLDMMLLTLVYEHEN